MPVRGRLWKLDYRHGMGATLLGGARAIDGHCGGGVGGMCGASGEMRVATRRSLYAHVYKHNAGALLNQCLAVSVWVVCACGRSLVVFVTSVLSSVVVYGGRSEVAICGVV